MKKYEYIVDTLGSLATSENIEGYLNRQAAEGYRVTSIAKLSDGRTFVVYEREIGE